MLRPWISWQGCVDGGPKASALSRRESMSTTDHGKAGETLADSLGSEEMENPNEEVSGLR